MGIAGHSFIATSLLAASFVYYRDIDNWVNEVINKVKTVTL